jgi:hypothetical protein
MRFLVLASLVLAAALAGSMWAEVLPAQTRPATRPATTQKSSDLLLLDDDPAPASAKPLTDNSRCHVCHINFEREELSLKHAQANIGCAKCHGQSDAHIADESWASGGKVTAPDIMYPLEKINAACMTCHSDKLDREKHKSFLAGSVEQKYCTECHGKHRMANRKCKWK